MKSLDGVLKKLISWIWNIVNTEDLEDIFLMSIQANIIFDITNYIFKVKKEALVLY